MTRQPYATERQTTTRQGITCHVPERLIGNKRLMLHHISDSTGSEPGLGRNASSISRSMENTSFESDMLWRRCAAHHDASLWRVYGLPRNSTRGDHCECLVKLRDTTTGCDRLHPQIVLIAWPLCWMLESNGDVTHLVALWQAVAGKPLVDLLRCQHLGSNSK